MAAGAAAARAAAKSRIIGWLQQGGDGPQDRVDLVRFRQSMAAAFDGQ